MTHVKLIESAGFCTDINWLFIHLKKCWGSCSTFRSLKNNDIPVVTVTLNFEGIFILYTSAWMRTHNVRGVCERPDPQDEVTTGSTVPKWSCYLKSAQRVRQRKGGKKKPSSLKKNVWSHAESEPIKRSQHRPNAGWGLYIYCGDCLMGNRRIDRWLIWWLNGVWKHRATSRQVRTNRVRNDRKVNNPRQWNCSRRKKDNNANKTLAIQHK